ncbi:MAG: hypothetical protein A2X12_09665, partial [Bacteroidetes bacterium GWE2_29_8]
YHSIHGAIEESEFVYIQNGLSKIPQKDIYVFELGFGTGLNAFLSIIYGIEQNVRIYYETIELYPISKDVWSNLNYGNYKESNYRLFFENLHASEWDTEKFIKISENFYFKKHHSDFLNFNMENNYDVFYFDSFSPDKVPHLWNIEVFKNIYPKLNNNGILTTYCSKGIVKEALRQAGFSVKRIKGLNYKKHIINAVKVQH